MPVPTASPSSAVDPRSWTATTVGDAAGWTHPVPDALIARLSPSTRRRAGATRRSPTCASPRTSGRR